MNPDASEKACGLQKKCGDLDGSPDEDIREPLQVDLVGYVPTWIPRPKERRKTNEANRIGSNRHGTTKVLPSLGKRREVGVSVAEHS